MAEQAFRHYADPALLCRSAGLEASSQQVHPVIQNLLLERGIDASAHRQTKITQELIQKTRVVVAMGLNHQAFLLASYARRVPLFNEVCCGVREPVLDICEAFSDWETRPRAIIESYFRSVVEHIFESMPLFLENWPRYQ